MIAYLDEEKLQCPVRLSYRLMSGREKHISYINAYMWNTENGTDEPIFKSRNRNTMRISVWTPRRGKEERDELGDWDWHVYTTMCKRDNLC